MQTSEKRLLKLCKRFIKEQDISCSETIYQTDRVSENALEFIEDIAEIVGYVEEEEDE